jgi:melanoma-associated antigen
VRVDTQTNYLQGGSRPGAEIPDDEGPRHRDIADEWLEDVPARGDSDEDDSMNIDQDESIESQLVTKFVRYALACEYARIPIRKEGIKEKGLTGGLVILAASNC